MKRFLALSTKKLQTQWNKIRVCYFPLTEQPLHPLWYRIEICRRKSHSIVNPKCCKRYVLAVRSDITCTTGYLWWDTASKVTRWLNALQVEVRSEKDPERTTTFWFCRTLERKKVTDKEDASMTAMATDNHPMKYSITVSTGNEKGATQVHFLCGNSSVILPRQQIICLILEFSRQISITLLEYKYVPYRVDWMLGKASSSVLRGR